MQIPYRKPGKYTNLVQDPHLTEARAFEIKKELDRLKKIVRPKLTVEVALLAEGGDFSENAGYQSAKGHLRAINEKIINYESQLRRAVIIRPKKKATVVELGHTVTISDGKKEKTYQILGSMEVDLKKGIISHNSPLGIKLIGRRAGEVVEVVAGGKKMKYKIMKIE